MSCCASRRGGYSWTLLCSWGCSEGLLTLRWKCCPDDQTVLLRPDVGTNTMSETSNNRRTCPEQNNARGPEVVRYIYWIGKICIDSSPFTNTFLAVVNRVSQTICVRDRFLDNDLSCLSRIKVLFWNYWTGDDELFAFYRIFFGKFYYLGRQYGKN